MLPNRCGNLKPLPQIWAVRQGIKSARYTFGKIKLDQRLRRPSTSTQRAALASATVNAVMLTMRRTVADGVRMCTGLAAPSSTGPIAMPPPAAVLSRL